MFHSIFVCVNFFSQNTDFVQKKPINCNRLCMQVGISFIYRFKCDRGLLCSKSTWKWGSYVLDTAVNSWQECQQLEQSVNLLRYNEWLHYNELPTNIYHFWIKIPTSVFYCRNMMHINQLSVITATCFDTQFLQGL